MNEENVASVVWVTFVQPVQPENWENENRRRKRKSIETCAVCVDSCSKNIYLNVTLHLPVSPSTNNALIRCIIVLQTVFWMGIVFVNFPNIYRHMIRFYFDKHFEVYLELVQARGGQVGFDPVGKQSDLARSSKLQNVLLQLHHTFLSRMCIIEGTNVMHTL